MKASSTFSRATNSELPLETADSIDRLPARSTGRARDSHREAKKNCPPQNRHSRFAIPAHRLAFAVIRTKTQSARKTHHCDRASSGRSAKKKYCRVSLIRGRIMVQGRTMRRNPGFTALTMAVQPHTARLSSSINVRLPNSRRAASEASFRDIPPATNSSIFSLRCSRISAERSSWIRRRDNSCRNQPIVHPALTTLHESAFSCTDLTRTAMPRWGPRASRAAWGCSTPST
jgi:hypothetical protein